MYAAYIVLDETREVTQQWRGSLAFTFGKQLRRQVKFRKGYMKENEQKETFIITKPIRLIELFAGYRSQAMALQRLEADFERYRVVEFDKYAIASYNAVHGTNFPTIDIRDVHASDLGICDTDRFTYLLTYSFPCTDLSVAGRQNGMSKSSGTRSGLLWEVERILAEIRDGKGELPQILFMENVPQVHGKKNIDDFQKWLNFLKSLGYSNYWKDLNAKDYGIPQNRNRCYMFSLLGDYSYIFPEPMPLDKKLIDFLEDNVDKKYYINNEKSRKLIKELVDSGRLNNTIFEQSRAEQSRAEQSRAEQSRAEQSRAEQSRAEQSRAEHVLTAQSRNLVSEKSQIASYQDIMQESAAEKGQVFAYLKQRGEILEKVAENACCLLARDYNGFSNRRSNGVIEWKLNS